MPIVDTAMSAAKRTVKVFAILGVIAAIVLTVSDRPLLPEIETLGGAIGVSFLIGVRVLLAASLLIVVFLYFFVSELRS